MSSNQALLHQQRDIHIRSSHFQLKHPWKMFIYNRSQNVNWPTDLLQHIKRAMNRLKSAQWVNSSVHHLPCNSCFIRWWMSPIREIFLCSRERGAIPISVNLLNGLPKSVKFVGRVQVWDHCLLTEKNNRKSKRHCHPVMKTKLWSNRRTPGVNVCTCPSSP